MVGPTRRRRPRRGVGRNAGRRRSVAGLFVGGRGDEGRSPCWPLAGFLTRWRGPTARHLWAMLMRPPRSADRCAHSATDRSRRQAAVRDKRTATFAFFLIG